MKPRWLFKSLDDKVQSWMGFSSYEDLKMFIIVLVIQKMDNEGTSTMINSSCRRMKQQQSRQIWVKKGEKSLLVFKATTRNEDFLKDPHECGVGKFTFGDGRKGRIIGKWVLKVGGVSKLKNVHLIKGLQTNFISSHRAIQGLPRLGNVITKPCSGRLKDNNLMIVLMKVWMLHVLKT
ncbi:hypothetical protein GOBAR_AA39460 [Gossypium barbadense]|uniref:Uncharacterized protein n=1 Tax=Gossypium barbadense TaxID=3634 RepID=A0A2P5VQY4_GOSBA|nr:hypothetical protein GOBAR_AA39460 [Gossypium barbadense]